MWGRYAGYTQGSSEYSVKSLTEREAAKLLSSAGVRRLYTPCPDTKPGLNNAGDNKQQQQQGKWGTTEKIMECVLICAKSEHLSGF